MNFGSSKQLAELMKKIDEYSLSSQRLDEKLGETTAALAKVKAYATSLATMLGGDTPHTHTAPRGRRRHRQNPVPRSSSRKARRSLALQSTTGLNIGSDEEMADI